MGTRFDCLSPPDRDAESLDDFLVAAGRRGGAMGEFLRCRGLAFTDGLRREIVARTRKASRSWGLPSGVVEAGLRSYLDGVEAILEPCEGSTVGERLDGTSR